MSLSSLTLNLLVSFLKNFDFFQLQKLELLQNPFFFFFKFEFEITFNFEKNEIFYLRFSIFFIEIPIFFFDFRKK